MSVVAISNSSSTIEYEQLPAANNKPLENLQVSVVDTQSTPVASADIAVAFKDGTFLQAKTDAQGVARFEDLKQLVVNVFVARTGYSPVNATDQIISRPVRLTLSSNGATNGILVAGRTGSIPGLQGRLEPVLDDNGPYLYADGIDINGGMAQPVHFTLGDELTLRDSTGATFELKVVAMTGQVTLLQYKEVAP
jgi:hypothetical protein